MSNRSSSRGGGSEGQRRGFTPPKGRPTRRRDDIGDRRSMSTLQWFLVVLGLIVLVVIVVRLAGPSTGGDPTPTGRSTISGVDYRGVVTAGLPS